jgi:hypothetical protein
MDHRGSSRHCHGRYLSLPGRSLSNPSGVNEPLLAGMDNPPLQDAASFFDPLYPNPAENSFPEDLFEDINYYPTEYQGLAQHANVIYHPVHAIGGYTYGDPAQLTPSRPSDHIYEPDSTTQECYFEHVDDKLAERPSTHHCSQTRASESRLEADPSSQLPPQLSSHTQPTLPTVTGNRRIEQSVEIPGSGCFAANGDHVEQTPSKGRKGGLSQDNRKKVAEVRLAGACSRCRKRKMAVRTLFIVQEHP